MKRGDKMINPAHKNLILKALDADGVKYSKVHLKEAGVNRYVVTVNGEYFGIFDVDKNTFVD